MRNRYPGVCYRCGLPVAAGAGHFEKIRGARTGEPRWRTQHAECAIAHRIEMERAAGDVPEPATAGTEGSD